MSQKSIPLVFLSVARPGLENDYAFQELLAHHLNVYVTTIHEALVPADVHPLQEDEFCADLPALFNTLQRFEDIDGRHLPQLVQEESARLFILMEDDRCHPEVLMAFGLLVAGYCGAWPEILCMHLEEDSPSEEWQVVYHFQPGLLLPTRTLRALEHTPRERGRDDE